MLKRYRDLPILIWLVLVLIPVSVLLVAGLLSRDLYNNYLMYKEGPVEWLSILVCLTGAAVSVYVFKHRQALPTRWFRWLPVVFLAGFIFMGGEESSWGQHLFNLRLPGQAEEVKNRGLANIDPREENSLKGEERDEVRNQLNWLQRMNDQSETNLHNLSGWKGDLFAKWPKQLIEYGSIFACVIVPLFLRKKWKLEDPNQLGYWFWPTYVCVPAALVAILLPWPKRLYELAVGSAPTELRLSEPQELYLGIMLLVYISSIAWRLKQHHAAMNTPAADQG